MVSTTSEAPANRAAFDPEAVVRALRTVLGGDGPIALHEPSLRGREWEYVKDCLDSGWVSYAGNYVGRFEGMLSEVTGARHAVAVVSGTAALHTALVLCGVRPGDEVLIPTLTFVATANAVAHAGAIPHFVDSERSTLGMDPSRLAEYLETVVEQRKGQCFNILTSRRIAAIMPVHVFGHPVDMDGLAAVAARYGIPLIEDAAESLGSSYKGRPTGSFGRVAALSFNGNKVVTTGGGGALLTDDPDLARAAKHLTTTAKLPHRWEFRHDAIAYNYRMPSLNAALGCAQLEQLAGFLSAKRLLSERYRAALRGVAGVEFVSEPAQSHSNYWLNALAIRPELASDFTARDALLAATNDVGIMTRPAWTLMHELPIYADCPRMDLSVAEELERRLVNIPSSPGLAEPR